MLVPQRTCGRSEFGSYSSSLRVTGSLNDAPLNAWDLGYGFSYRGADKSLARPNSRCILFDGENISFDASLVLYIYIYIYIYSTNIPPIIIINRIYENQNLLSL